MTVVGADGCPAGWFAVAVTDEGLDYGVHDSVADIVSATPNADEVLLDVPIGLPVAEVRDCDRLAREMLGCRGASVFLTPCRAAVYAADHETAKDANRDALGRSVSIQAWNIRGKIRDADGFLQANPDAPVVESHPELCFFGLNEESPMAYPKTTAKGRDVRLSVLEDEHAEARAVYASALDDYRRKDVSRDDVLDALALAVAGTKERSTIPADPPTDGEDLPLRIQYPGPSYEAWQRTNLPPNG